MSKFFSTNAIMAAFSLLKENLPSGTRFSALQYLLALDNYVHVYGGDCDINTEEDTFIAFAHKVAALEDGEVPDHIDSFNGNRPKKGTDRARIHSNFISAGAVSKSERATRENPELYPSKQNTCLFAISQKVLLADSIRYDHLDLYLPTKPIKTAFAIWVTRNSAFADNQSFADGLKSALSQDYTDKLVAALWSDGAPSLSDLNLNDDAFSYERPRITWSLIGRYFPMDEPEDKRSVLSEASQARQDKKPQERTLGLPHNWIFFGAPGTGKSYRLNKLAKESFSRENINRVTFHPDYTYSQFVGCFKPYSEPGSTNISYKYIPGPFLKTYLKAITHPYDNYVLLIEEINRANPAGVFGDVFQLLDRGGDQDRDYAVTTSTEMGDCIEYYLRNELNEKERNDIEAYYDPDLTFEDFCKMERASLFLPPNMYIWATMNSADQGVYPMDTAFKRRWDFKYIGINDGANAVIDGVALSEIEVPCGTQTVKWNDLRVAINNFLLTDGIRVNEDKLLGPFFIAPASLAPEKFTRVFENKVLMYLHEDAGKSKRPRLFRSDLKTYSQICDAFETMGTAIFGDGFVAPKPCGEKQADTNDADGSEE